jgi:hypothetical protein
MVEDQGEGVEVEMGGGDDQLYICHLRSGAGRPRCQGEGAENGRKEEGNSGHEPGEDGNTWGTETPRGRK